MREIYERLQSIINKDHAVVPDTDFIPDKLYFSSPSKITGNKLYAVTCRGIFMSPYIGLSSMFIIDRSKELRAIATRIYEKEGKRIVGSDYNIEYDGFYKDPNKLSKPLKMVRMYHNVPEIQGTYNGISHGYIYEVDVSEVKDQLALPFNGENGIREVLYVGNEPLTILRCIPHDIRWNLSYRKQKTMGIFITS